MPSHGEEDEDKPCRACSDFKSWAKSRTKATTTKTQDTTPKESEPALEPPKEPVRECPLDKDELGRSTWGFLHSMASYYPETPTRSQSESMCKFFQIFSEFYPCEPCARDFQEDIKKHPPRTKSRAELERWLCERHNTVNIKLDKPTFDCSKINERWKEGWKDGSCD